MVLIILLRGHDIVDTSLLRRLRFIEGVLFNIPFILVVLTILPMPLYLGISQRLTAVFVLVLFSCSIRFGHRLNNLFYVRLFPCLKPLWDYEQQKLISDKWIKWRRNSRVFNAIMIIGLILFALYLPPMLKQINWESLWCSITGSLIGYNIGMVWKVLTEKFYY